MFDSYGTAMPACTVQLWYNKQRPKKNGKVSLYLQLIIGGESAEVPIKNLEWPIEFIDWNKKCLLPRIPGDDELMVYNAIIERERSKYWGAIMNFLKQDISFTIGDIFKTVNQFSSGHLFCEFWESAIIARVKTQKPRDKIKFTTIRPHRSSLKQFREFLNGKDILISNITDELLEKYAEYLRKKMSESTVWVRIKDVKSYLSYAARQKIAVNPSYKLFTVTASEPEPIWLDEDELKILLNTYRENTLSPAKRRVLRAFLFACFTGLRISDLKRWNKNWIRGDEIVFVPQKMRVTKKDPKPLVIPIIPIAQGFINDLSSESFDIPIDQAYNRELRSIASLPSVNISKHLSSHVARHTFATWLAIDNVPVLIISKLLGHKRIETTMIYVHLAEMHKAREMMKMQRRFGSLRAG